MNPLELLFRKGNQTIFLPQILLKLGDLDFIVPVSISISLRKKIVITEIYGADFSVKEDFGCSDFQIRIDGRIGNTDSSVGAKICGINKNVSALDFFVKLIALYKKKMPLKINDVSQDFVGNFIGQTVKKIDQAFDLPFGGSEEPEGLLNKLGITKIILIDLDIEPLPAGHYRFHIEAISESSDTDILETNKLKQTNKLNLFLEEQ